MGDDNGIKLKAKAMLPPMERRAGRFLTLKANSATAVGTRRSASQFNATKNASGAFQIVKKYLEVPWWKDGISAKKRKN